MRITKICLKNFKRFTDLTIAHLPARTRLVLLTGANGAGKSSLFDAFGFCMEMTRQATDRNTDEWNGYYRKDKAVAPSISIEFGKGHGMLLYDGMVFLKPDAAATEFYLRTGFRQISRLTAAADIAPASTTFFTDMDSQFDYDIQKITGLIINDVFRSNQPAERIIETYITPINNAFKRIFGEENSHCLQLLTMIPPLSGQPARIFFRKGTTEFHYDCLSLGEKEIFNILLNLLTHGRTYADTLFAIDDLDLHIDASIRFNFLKEITEYWIPDNSQLWVAAHSAEFAEYARQNEQAVIINFANLDFDKPQILMPEPKDNPDICEVAVSRSFLLTLFKNMDVYYVNEKDKAYFASAELSNAVFIPDPKRDNIYEKAISDDGILGIIDREFLTDDDTVQLRKNFPQLYILDYYSIENYLYHPDNMEEYHFEHGLIFDRDSYIRRLTEAKNQMKDSFLPVLGLKRTEYPFFDKPEFAGTPLQNRFRNKRENEEQAATLARNISSDDFETFYKLLPMKLYVTQLPERNNISTAELARTRWFKSKMELLLFG
ncbi:MAG: AAA family ATPase [Bacteroidales bacterium]|jgi:hypothetical protein|nr:AAA family ATPase [Bacteroidales bacterium]